MSTAARTAAHLVIVALVALAFLVCTAQTTASQDQAQQEQVTSWDTDTASDVPALEEDEQGWDCQTMGNQTCQPTH